MGRCAIYCRVSSDEQAEKGTVEGQVDYAKKYLDLHGPEVGITEHEFYIDEGISGTIPVKERPEGARLVADALAGKFQILFVYRLDRLARSVKHVLDTYELLESNKIALKSMTEAFDTGTPTGKFFMTLLASIAALERDTILERTLMGKERKAKQGKWVSGMPPYGYRIGADGALEIYEPEADTVRLIYKLYRDGMSTIEIAKYLNARKIPTPAKSKGTKNKSTGLWHAGHISIILRAEVYTGTYDYLTRSKRKKDVIPMEVPTIIDKLTFKSIQKKLIENADVARGRRGRYYLLRGLIYCGKCGRAMVGSSGNSKKGRVYYRCTGVMNNGAGKRCDAKMIRAIDIEDAVWQDVLSFMQNPGKIIKIMEGKLKKNKKDLSPVKQEMSEVEDAILNKQASRGKVLSLCARDIVTDREAEVELQSLAREIETLMARRDMLFGQMEAAQRIETEALTAQTMLEKLSGKLQDLTDEKKAELIRGITRRVDIFTELQEGKRVSKAIIAYRFFDNQGLYEFKHLSKLLDPYKHMDIETAWLFQAVRRSGSGGERIGIQ